MNNPINVFAVIGAGQMGVGIAQTAAAIAKIPKVILYDNQSLQLTKQHDFLKKMLERDVAKQKITQTDYAAILARITTTTNLADLSHADFVVEAISENVQAKTTLFKQLESYLDSEKAIVASNTSSISITKLAASYKNPAKFIGMHFMNPVPIMKLVEIIPGNQTEKATMDSTIQLAKAMGKTTTTAADVPGFIANRLLMPYINEAIFALYEGVATREDIDTTMVLGTNVPMGPLRLADFVGLDTCLAIMHVLHEGYGDSKYRPCPLLVRHVNAGWLGRKSGRGFYDYTTIGDPNRNLA